MTHKKNVVYLKVNVFLFTGDILISIDNKKVSWNTLRTVLLYAKKQVPVSAFLCIILSVEIKFILVLLSITM